MKDARSRINGSIGSLVRAYVDSGAYLYRRQPEKYSASSVMTYAKAKLLNNSFATKITAKGITRIILDVSRSTKPKLSRLPAESALRAEGAIKPGSPIYPSGRRNTLRVKGADARSRT